VSRSCERVVVASRRHMQHASCMATVSWQHSTKNESCHRQHALFDEHCSPFFYFSPRVLRPEHPATPPSLAMRVHTPLLLPIADNSCPKSHAGEQTFDVDPQSTVCARTDSPCDVGSIAAQLAVQRAQIGRCQHVLVCVRRKRLCVWPLHTLHNHEHSSNCQHCTYLSCARVAMHAVHTVDQSCICSH
jgi:hypothetical protein